MYHQYWKSPFRKGFVWSPARWSPSINGWGCPLVLVNDEMRICIPWRNWGKPQENWTLYVELGKDITLHDVHKALPKLFIRSFQIPAVRIGWRSVKKSSLVPTGSVIFSSGFENPSNIRFYEAGSNSLATPRKILKDDHSDPPKAHCFIEKTRETTAQVFSHMTSMRQQRWSLEHQGVLDGLLRNHVLWGKWREQHPVCQSLHF